MMEPWERWEHDVQELLGLDATPASGARFQAIGDGVDNHHPADTVFPLIVDCKATEKGSFSLKSKDLQQWHANAMALGKRFAMPIRFWNRGNNRSADYILLGINDFAELLELARGRRLDEWSDIQVGRTVCIVGQHPRAGETGEVISRTGPRGKPAVRVRLDDGSLFYVPCDQWER